MNVKSFGCSYVFGTDLRDIANDHSLTPSQISWPALLAEKNKFGYECYALAGSGNLKILERLLNNIATDPSGLFIISWSWIDRFDYVNYVNDSWVTLMPADPTDGADYYYKHFHSQLRDKFSTLTGIRLAIDTLKQFNCQFIMTYVDELIFEEQWHTSPGIKQLQDYIRPYMTKFEGQTFVEWSKKKGFAFSKTLHPLEEAHCAAADYLQSSINKV